MRLIEISKKVTAAMKPMRVRTVFRVMAVTRPELIRRSMMKTGKTLALVALLTAPAAPALAQSMSSATYVMKAGASDLYERESSKLLLTSTANPQLKSFAQMMVTDHTKSTADVKKAAMKAKVKVAPPKLNAEQSSNMAALRAARGTARDSLYIEQQKTAHQEALMVQQDEADNGRAASLKMAASNIVPVVQHHIEMLNGM